MGESARSFIRFIGTGAGDFYEEHQRDCEDGHCARAKAMGGRNVRRASSLFVAPDMLVDFYDAEVLCLRSIEPSAVRHLFITHGHYDHFQPARIVEVAEASESPFTVYGSRGVEDALRFAGDYTWDAEQASFRCRKRCPAVPTRAMQPGESVTVGEAKVTAVHANHMIDKRRQILEQQALNYVIERDGRTLFYGVDTSTILPRTSEALRAFRFDILVLDATFGCLEIDPQVSGHHNFAMVEETVRQFRSAGLLTSEALVVATHISCHHVPPHDDIAEQLPERGITLAYDGLELGF